MRRSRDAWNLCQPSAQSSIFPLFSCICGADRNCQGSRNGGQDTKGFWRFGMAGRTDTTLSLDKGKPRRSTIAESGKMMIPLWRASPLRGASTLCGLARTARVTGKREEPERRRAVRRVHRRRWKENSFPRPIMAGSEKVPQTVSRDFQTIAEPKNIYCPVHGLISKGGKGCSRSVRVKGIPALTIFLSFLSKLLGCVPASLIISFFDLSVRFKSKP